MKQSEIMTLLNAGVKQSVIAGAIVAGKMESILTATERDIARAQEFDQSAEWKELIRVMEGTLDSQRRHKSNPTY